MKRNHHRFYHEPHITEKRKNGFTFQFSGIILELQRYIGKNVIFEIRVHFQDTFWNILTDFDVFPFHTRQGQFYCYFCNYTQDEPLLYDSKRELRSNIV